MFTTLPDAAARRANPQKPPRPSKPVTRRHRAGKPIIEEEAEAQSSEDESSSSSSSSEEVSITRREAGKDAVRGTGERREEESTLENENTTTTTRPARPRNDLVKEKVQKPAAPSRGYVQDEADELIRQVKAEAGSGRDEVRAEESSEEEEESSSEEDEDEDEDESEEEEESSSEDETARRKMIRPTFIKKDARNKAPNNNNAATTVDTPDLEKEAELRQAKADMYIKDQLEKDAAARLAAKKSWDDDEDDVEGVDEEQINDQDGIDPEAEFAAWKLRELQRVKRGREELEAEEQERSEIERRRKLTAEEREREDLERLEKQKEERGEKGKAGYMQRYFHKGAFFRDELAKDNLDSRDLMGSSYADEIKNRETLPQYLQVRDATKIGKKGRTRYRDLRHEDTGRWAVEGYNRPAEANNAERFGLKRKDDER